MAEPGFDVIVCGSLHLDIVVRAPALPRLDETAVGSSWAQVCGGKGGNQAVQAARAGARTAMIGRIGRDDFGARLAAHLTDAGVDASAVSIDPVNGSGMSVAIVRDDGDYGAVIVSGANLTTEPATIAAEWARLGGAGVLVLQNEIPHSVNVAAARAARAAGARVVLNAAPARPAGADLMDLVDILVVNRVEAEMLGGGGGGGGGVADRAGAMAVLPALIEGRRSVVVTLGGDGLVVAPLGAPARVIEAVAVDVVSTHGAGDCFVGTLAARLAAGADLLTACERANAAAAAHVAGQPIDRQISDQPKGLRGQ